MKLAARVMFHGICIALILTFAATTSWAQEYSHARIVRLSFVEGPVTVQRPDVSEWAEALVNTPIQEGFKVATEEGGFTEVEFENASTARVGQLSLLEFTQLVLMPSGDKVNRIRLHYGYATFNVVPEGEDFYEVTAGEATLTPRGKARFRLDLEEGVLVVKVFKGSVEITSPEGTGTVGENAMVELRPGAEPVFQISQGFTRDSWDEWVEQREGQVRLARHGWSPTVYSNDVTSLLYGWSDLIYYGNWVNLPGYRVAWIPAVSAGWAPYTLGRWCWYPGYGYTWISGEPWGWLPYHYGNWIYQPGLGWCWIPGNFSIWSPALVTWYRGPGWVGWAPRGSPRLGGGQDNCPAQSGCGTAVSEEVFREGGTVTPEGRRGFDPREGWVVETPDIPPSRLAQLPGSPWRRMVPEAVGGLRKAGSLPAGGELPGATEVFTTPETAVRPREVRPPGAARGDLETTSSERGIVFDPEQRLFVNNPNVARKANVEGAVAPTSPGEESAGQAEPAATGPALAGEGGSRGALGRVGRPGPTTSFPASRVGKPGGEGPEFDDSSAGSHLSSRPTSSDSGGVTPARQGRDSGSRDVWSSKSDSSGPARSATRSTKSSSSRQEGGSVSESFSSRDTGSRSYSRSDSGSSGAIRSSDGGYSGSSKGGYSGGSSGGYSGGSSSVGSGGGSRGPVGGSRVGSSGGGSKPGGPSRR